MSDEEKDEGLTDFGRLGGLDPAVDELLKEGRRRRREAQLPLRERRKKVRQRRKNKARRGRRAVYDLEPELIEVVKDLAAEHQVPASQVAALLLQLGLEAFAAGAVDIEALKVPSDSPRYAWNLDLEPWEG